ncbi:hypothetical protein FRC09_011499 [Ceratobasidium sp. 395]|nr:hypothetical protein FRC09_011499 [Ceratobasidium sp. 395]
MVMTIRSFQSHQEIWEWKSRNGQATPGMRAWACRRSRFFVDLSRQMLDASLKYLRDDTIRLPWAEKWLAANVLGHVCRLIIKISRIRPDRVTCGNVVLAFSLHHNRYNKPPHLIVKNISSVPFSLTLWFAGYKVRMQRERPKWDDTALRALCEGLDVQMFGPGGYDEFIAGIIRDSRPHSGTDFAEQNDVQNGNALPNIKKAPRTSSKKTTNPKNKRAPSGLILSSRGSVTLTPSSGPAQLSGPKISSPKDDKPFMNKPRASNQHQRQHDGIVEQLIDEPTSPLNPCSPMSQASHTSISSTIRASTSSPSPPPSPSPSLLSCQSERQVDELIGEV